MDAYKTAALTVLAAVRNYLPPDGITKDELISRVIEAVDNPAFNAGTHGWRDISSAPKDGTPVLLFLPPTPNFDASMTTGVWHKLYEDWQLCETGGYAEDADVHPRPTHWQPLPEPPK